MGDSHGSLGAEPCPCRTQPTHQHGGHLVHQPRKHPLVSTNSHDVCSVHGMAMARCHTHFPDGRSHRAIHNGDPPTQAHVRTHPTASRGRSTALRAHFFFPQRTHSQRYGDRRGHGLPPMPAHSLGWTAYADQRLRHRIRAAHGHLARVPGAPLVKRCPCRMVYRLAVPRGVDSCGAGDSIHSAG